MNCVFIGRLSGAKGAVWQYTAIDVASAYCWAELHLTPRNPLARFTSELTRRVAADLVERGWVGAREGDQRQRIGVPLRRVRAGRGTTGSPPPVHPRRQANGVVERVQETISRSAGSGPSPAT